jgi:hypothetical protein
MHKRTVKSGLNLIVAGIVAIIMATFYHGEVSQLLSLTVSGQNRLIVFGLFCGGLSSGLGIIVALVGLLRNQAESNDTGLSRTIVVLIAVVLLFFYLFYRSIGAPHPPPLRQGETIII